MNVCMWSGHVHVRVARKHPRELNAHLNVHVHVAQGPVELCLAGPVPVEYGVELRQHRALGAPVHALDHELPRALQVVFHEPLHCLTVEIPSVGNLNVDISRSFRDRRVDTLPVGLTM